MPIQSEHCIPTQKRFQICEFLLNTLAKAKTFFQF